MLNYLQIESKFWISISHIFKIFWREFSEAVIVTGIEKKMNNSKHRSDNEELRRAAANGLVETVEKLLELKAGIFCSQEYKSRFWKSGN